MSIRLNASISPELRGHLVSTYGEASLANHAIGKLASVAFDALRAAGQDIGFESLLKLEDLDLGAVASDTQSQDPPTPEQMFETSKLMAPAQRGELLMKIAELHKLGIYTKGAMPDEFYRPTPDLALKVAKRLNEDDSIEFLTEIADHFGWKVVPKDDGTADYSADQDTSTDDLVNQLLSND